jgi:predicted MFS family arabinose efflux permease
MKKSILSFFLLFTASLAFSQDTLLTKEQHLRKSRSSKTAGWILMGGGVGMLVGSLATYEFTIDLGPMFGGPPSSSKVDNTTSTLLAIGGAAAIVGSIISFSSSKEHKKKAAALTFGNQHVPVLRQNGFVSQLQPALQLRIPLGNQKPANRRLLR